MLKFKPMSAERVDSGQISKLIVRKFSQVDGPMDEETFNGIITGQDEDATAADIARASILKNCLSKASRARMFAVIEKRKQKQAKDSA